MSTMTCTTPHPLSLSLSLVHLRTATVMKSCLVGDKNGWWCNHGLSNSDFNFARFLSNYFSLVALTFVLSVYELGFPARVDTTIWVFAGYGECIPNIAHSLSSMTVFYIQTLCFMIRYFAFNNQIGILLCTEL